MSMSKHNKIYQWLNYRMKLTIQDNRTIIGTFLAFDKHMNVVLSDAEELRIVLSKKAGGEDQEQRRSLGLTVIRGECIIAITVEGPPPPDESARMRGIGLAGAAMGAGPGIGRAGGRGVGMPSNMPAPGLAGPIRGMGAPGTALMTPGGRGTTQVAAAAPMAYGVPPPGMPPPGVPPPMPPFARGAPFPPGRGMPMMPPNMMAMGRGVPPPLPPGFGRGMPGFFPPGSQPPPSQ